MAINVAKTVETLNRMTVTQLRERYAEVFGEGSRSYNKQHLVKRIAWRLQALEEGDLSERARRRARELANDADLRIRPPAAALAQTETPAQTFVISPDARLPMPGTLLKREYKGRTIQVRVLPQGFEFQGETYRSLTAIAHVITGTHWNGFHFFGITKPSKEKV